MRSKLSIVVPAGALGAATGHKKNPSNFFLRRNANLAGEFAGRCCWVSVVLFGCTDLPLGLLGPFTQIFTAYAIVRTEPSALSARGKKKKEPKQCPGSFHPSMELLDGTNAKLPCRSLTVSSTRRRMARERRGAGSSVVSIETPYCKAIY